MSPEYGTILFSVDRSVATVSLNRPDSLNAFSGQMGEELQDAYRRCDADDAIRAVVLTGTGRAFCAGADFSGGAGVFGSQKGSSGFSSDPFDFHAWDVRKPVIAALNGHAIGLGLTMALQTDIRLVAADAKLGIVQNRRGVQPPAIKGGLQSLRAQRFTQVGQGRGASSRHDVDPVPTTWRACAT